MQESIGKRLQRLTFSKLTFRGSRKRRSKWRWKRVESCKSVERAASSYAGSGCRRTQRWIK
ncbi:hypothetical protein NC652_002520 [Populus alba x Populus x berolinensis]|nr:hypothetical protein NC652_002520 [Populus alba x Populus x berolinensis]